MTAQRITLDKRTVCIMLVRLAQSNDPASDGLYSVLIDGWLHRTDRRKMPIDLNAVERELLRRECPTEMKLLGVTL